MIVIKFGGTSVASVERIRTVIEIVKTQIQKKPVVVVSAARGATDLLLEGDINQVRELYLKLVSKLFPKNMTEEVADYINSHLEQAQKIANRPNLSASDLDELASYGEVISSFIVSKALLQAEINSAQIIASDLIVTNNHFGQAEFLPEETREKALAILAPLIDQAKIPVVTGFIGATREGEITTLGRGGSDYTASILGFCLDAEEIQIWTDVDGIYTSDPRVVKKAKLIPQISYREASEMAWFGSKVLHPRTIRPAIKGGIPVRILNTFNPETSGTLITEEVGESGLKVVSFKKDVTLVNIYSTSMLFSKGFLAKVFDIFTKYNISIDLVSVSEVSVSITLDNSDNLSGVIEELEKFSTVSVSNEFGIISLIGEGVGSFYHLIRDVSDLFSRAEIGIRMISLGASDINIGLVIASTDIEEAVNLVHNQILLKSESRLNESIQATFAQRI